MKRRGILVSLLSAVSVLLIACGAQDDSTIERTVDESETESEPIVEEWLEGMKYEFDDENWISYENLNESPNVSIYCEDEVLGRLCYNLVVDGFKNNFNDFLVSCVEGEDIFSYNIIGGYVVIGDVLEVTENADDKQIEKAEEFYKTCMEYFNANPYIIDGFEKAEYEKFNSLESENGLGETKIYVEGKFGDTYTEHTDEVKITLKLVQEDGDEWILGMPNSESGKSVIEELREKNGEVRVFGIYQGYSQTENLPVFMCISTSENKEDWKKIRIESKNDNGKYESLWTAYDWHEEIESSDGSSNSENNTKYQMGQYKVGQDIPAGEYVLFSENGSSGYFGVTSDANGDDIIFNDNFDYNSIITVYEGEYLELSRCYAVPFSENPEIDKSKAGMLKVGTHIPAGEYKLISDDDMGYYCIYNNSRQDDIISNDNFSGQSYINVYDGQYLVLSRCTIE